MTTQTRWQAAAILGTLAAIVAVALPASAGPDAPSADQSPAAAPGLPVTVNNGAANPVPVKAQGPTDVTGTVNIGNLPATQQVAGTVNIGNFPASTPAPLWQGTPYVRASGFIPGCIEHPIPAGQVLFAERAVAMAVHEPSDNGLLWLRVTALGNPGSRDTAIALPTRPGPNSIEGKVGYTGSVELGVPLTEIAVCGEGDGTITVLGYLVPAPE